MNGKKNEQLSSADVNEDAQKLEVFAMDTLQEDDCQLPEPKFACF
jgi:hypothetical protein